MRRRPPVAALVVLPAVSLLLTGCGNSSPRPPSPSGISVKASDTACLVASTSLASGTQTFAVSNAGSQVTAVYVYAPGDRVVGDVENIGPSSSKRLTVALKPGPYEISCRSGMVGKGIRTPIVVEGPGDAAPTTSPQQDAAVARYRSYVVAQAELLRSRTRLLATAIQAGNAGNAGNIAKAKSLYAPARIPYESIEPIAQSSGDLDPRIDARIDEVEIGQTWTGFHRLEHDLWTSDDVSADGGVATQLIADVAKLVDQVQRVELSADEIGSAAKTLIDGVLSTKITGEEERYSRLDLVDVSASLEGSDMAYRALRPIILTTSPELVTQLDTRFAAALQDLAPYGHGASFVRYDTLSKAQIRALQDDLSALKSPLSQLAAAALKA